MLRGLLVNLHWFLLALVIVFLIGFFKPLPKDPELELKERGPDKEPPL